jgi:hypothetical protein
MFPGSRACFLARFQKVLLVGINLLSEFCLKQG